MRGIAAFLRTGLNVAEQIAFGACNLTRTRPSNEVTRPRWGISLDGGRWRRRATAAFGARSASSDHPRCSYLKEYFGRS